MTKSPRQEAIRLGLDWYLPSKPCGHCNTVSLKRVNNGECKGCHDLPKKKRLDETTVLPNDTIITRLNAIELGLLFYRTGKQCNNGHDSFRYVSTRHCVECMTK